MNSSTRRAACPACRAARHEQEFDARAAYEVLARKHTDLADRVARYMSEAGLERPERTARAAALAREVERIVGGRPSEPGAFPECCLVGTALPNGAETWFCTGVLIHPRIVLTAGHCQDPRRSPIKRVALRAVDFSNLAGAEIIAVQRAVVHPEFLAGRHHDVTVLILRKPAVTPPVPIATTAELAAATRVHLVGFGNDDVRSTAGFGRQRQVEVDITSLRRAVGDDLDADEARFGYESDVEFVAGGEGKDTCNGDSGGPAYIMTGSQRKVVGLTSRATEIATNPCGDGGIYTRIDQQLDFIEHVAASAQVPL